MISKRSPVLFAILLQFVVAKSAWPAPVQFARLGAFHVAACAGVYLFVALAANRILRPRPGTARIVGRVSGTAMINVALALTLERMLSA